MAVDPTGRVFAADTAGNRIELFAPSTGAFAGQWTSATGHPFESPAGLAADPAGSIYVANRGRASVLRFWGDGTYLSELGGAANIGGASLNGAGSVASAAQVTYVADSGHNRVLVYSPEGTLIGKWGADDGNGAAGTGPVQFSRPQALAVGPEGDVYVADTGNNRVQRISPGGELLGSWGSSGSGDGRFHTPNGIALDAAGDVYVLDSENNRVQVFGPNGRFLERFGNRGTGLGQFSQPSALAIGCEGDVYVADTNNNRIERFAPVDAQPSGCLAASAWPPPLDVAPVLTVNLLRPRGVLARRGLSMSISCQRGCKVLVTATLAPYAAAKRTVTLAGAARGLPPATVGHVRLRLGALGRQRLKRALGRRHGLRATVTVVAAGPTGRRTTVRRSWLVYR